MNRMDAQIVQMHSDDRFKTIQDLLPTSLPYYCMLRRPARDTLEAEVWVKTVTESGRRFMVA